MSSTARIFLLRHGATVPSAEGRLAGSTDVALFNEVSHGAGQPETSKARLSKWRDAGEAADDVDRVR